MRVFLILTEVESLASASETLDEYRNELNGLERKAEIMRIIHLKKAKRYKWELNIITFASVISSIFITFLSIADPSLFGFDPSSGNMFLAIIGILGIAVLVLSLIDRLFEINRKLTDHQQAEKLLTEFIRDSHHVRQCKLTDANMDLTERIVDSTRESYLTIIRIIPTTDDDEEFIKAKQRLALKVEASKMIDKDPHADLNGIRKEIRRLK